MKNTRTPAQFDRREFIKRGAIASLGVGLMPIAGAAAAIAPEAGPPKIRRYVALGRTGMKISDISFGSSRLRSGQEDIVRHAFDAGINYFDSANEYGGGESEITIGNALRGKRDKVYLTSKLITAPDTQRGEMMSALESSLKRLQTDHVDVYFNHAVNNVERLKNPEWHAFTADARKQGKIRYVGMSGHAGHLIECLDYAIDNNQVDVILAAYNFGQDPRFYQRFLGGFDFVARQPDLPRVLEKAHSKGVGVVVMKTLMGARLNDMRPYEKDGTSFAPAAFRWVLSNPNVNALIVSMTSDQIIDEYLSASGWRTAAAGDLPILGRYAQINGTSYCRHACDACESSCPNGVPIADVMRTRMYANDYGDVRLARAEYAMLASNAAACLSCTAKPCASACPHGVAVADLTAPTHRMLS